jgi:hypothetical protein
MQYMELADIQHAIESLPQEQQGALLAWLADRDYAVWDTEMERDFSGAGPGIKLLEQVKTRIARGESRPMSESRPIG